MHFSSQWFHLKATVEPASGTKVKPRAPETRATGIPAHRPVPFVAVGLVLWVAMLRRGSLVLIVMTHRYESLIKKANFANK